MLQTQHIRLSNSVSYYIGEKAKSLCIAQSLYWFEHDIVQNSSLTDLLTPLLHSALSYFLNKMKVS